jgi:cyclophilin family peptidyl-prolyl cis-trans isomerase
MKPFLPLLPLLLAFAPAAFSAALPDGLYAEITTPRGTITTRLHYERAPLTVASFVGLAEGTLGPAPGKPFFDGLSFHRVVPNFVIQGGCPLGTGEGEPGYRFPDEFAPGLHHDAAGVLSMANGGPDTNGSQFFITLKDTTRLNYLHSVFGRVVSGLEFIDKVQKGDLMKVRILRVGAAAESFHPTPARFAALRAAAKAYRGSEEPGPKAAFDDPDKLLPTEPPRARGFNFKLSNFERATGLVLRARLYAKTPAALSQPDSEACSAALKSLAAELGVGASGTLAVYLADRDAWLLQGAAGTAATQQAAQALALRFTEESKRMVPPGQAFTEAMALKVKVDAMLDTLILQLEPRQP